MVGLLNLSAGDLDQLPVRPPVVLAAEASAAKVPLAVLAQRDPMALIRLAQERVNREVRDYSAIFLKQEEIAGKLGPLQRIDIRFRSDPVSVKMHWLENADQARKVVYQSTPKFVDPQGRKVARIEPAGFVARALFPEVTRPISGPDARAASRRTIDEFGFKATLDLFEKYNSLALKKGALDLRYTGEGRVDGRPTFVVERYLPYTPGGAFPDARLIVHFDQEWLVPTTVYSYADAEGTKLLGSYVFINVRLNVGLSDADFDL